MPLPPYLEQYYLNDAAPMFPGDPSGAMNQCMADYRAVGREPDLQYSVWGIRTERDYCAGMTIDASWRKHRNEMRAMLDPTGQILPPL